MHKTNGNMSGQHRRQKRRHEGHYYEWPADLPEGFLGLRYWRASTMTEEELQTCYKGCCILVRHLSEQKDRNRNTRERWRYEMRYVRAEMLKRGMEPPDWLRSKPHVCDETLRRRPDSDSGAGRPQGE